MSNLKILRPPPPFKHVKTSEELEQTLRPYLEEAAGYLSDSEWHTSINKELYHILFVAQEIVNDEPVIYQHILRIVLQSLETKWLHIIKTQQLLSSSAFLLESVRRLSQNPLVLNKKLKIKSLRTSLQPLFSTIVKDFGELILDKYASILVRHCLKLMAGIATTLDHQPDASKQTVIHSSDIIQMWPLDDEISDHLKGFYNSFLLPNSSRQLMEHESASPCLQLLIVAASIRLPDDFTKICKQLLKKKCHLWSVRGNEVVHGGTAVTLPASLQHPVCSYFVEQLIALLPDQLLEKCIKRYIVNRELHLCQDKQATYILQRVILSVPSTNVSQHMHLLNAVLPHLQSFPLADIHKVLQSFIKAALACKSTQKVLITHLQTIFNCTESSASQLQLFPAILCLRPYEEGTIYLSETPDHVGTLLLQNLLQFKKPQALIDSFIECSTVQKLELWCCHASASHVIDCLFQYKCMTLEEKIKVVQKLLPICTKLACDKFGSRILDTLWNLKSVPVRKMLAEVLVKDVDVLRNHKFGGFTFQKFALGHYSRSYPNWLQRYGSLGCEEHTKQSSKPASKQKTVNNKPQSKTQQKRPSSHNITSSAKKPKIQCK